jgi:hypothetical protein
MLVTAEDVAATLRLLVPGFVALSVFYWFGLAVKRTDWRWTLWSLVASVPIAYVAQLVAGWLGAAEKSLAAAFADCGLDALEGLMRSAERREALEGCANSSIAANHPEVTLGIAVLLAVLIGAVAAIIWRRIAEVQPSWLRRMQPNAWGAYLRDSRWLLLKTEDGMYSGWAQSVADPVETDDLDLLLGDPEALVDGVYQPIPGVEALLVRREDIKWVALLESR